MDISMFSANLRILEKDSERTHIEYPKVLVCHPTKLVEVEDIKYNSEFNIVVIYCDWKSEWRGNA